MTQPPKPGSSTKEERLKREAEALRANLRKRKEQARARTERPADATESSDRPRETDGA